MESSPHNEMQPIVDHMERPYGDEDYDLDFEDYDFDPGDE